MAYKVIVERVSHLPNKITAEETKIIDLRSLNPEQREYFEKAWKAFQKNMRCWDFDGPFFFLSSSPIWNLIPNRHHPLYRALKELWLALGVNQGQMASENNRSIYIIMSE